MLFYLTLWGTIFDKESDFKWQSYTSSQGLTGWPNRCYETSYSYDWLFNFLYAKCYYQPIFLALFALSLLRNNRVLESNASNQTSKLYSLLFIITREYTVFWFYHQYFNTWRDLIIRFAYQAYVRECIYQIWFKLNAL